MKLRPNEGKTDLLKTFMLTDAELSYLDED